MVHKKVRTLAQLRDDPRVVEVWNEGGDGWWASLVRGWSRNDEAVHCLHKDTIKQLCEELNTNTTECESDCHCKPGPNERY